MCCRPRLSTGTVVCLLLAGMSASAQEAGDTLFEKRVRPLLVDHCYECHSGESVESELRADSLQGLLKGGVRGPALVPGDPERSLLILAVNHADQLHMPPKSKLPSHAIADLTAWVKSGAPWPGSDSSETTPADSAKGATESASPRSLWSLEPAQAVPPPASGTGAATRSPVDTFIHARLSAEGLRQAPPASRRALLRRATFDLVGLPPTIEEIQAFLSDGAPDAFERVVDRLLASPRYGERWGRRWLDVARYADSNGLDENLAYANAFHYRDYVVRSFNIDRPYDEFVRQQIAGDLLTSDDVQSNLELVTATGFLSLGAKMLAEDDPVKMQMDIVDEQIDTIGRAFMGLTIGCARCHDHKYDPIPTADYYSLAGIFLSTKTMENFKVVARWREVPLATPDEVRAADALRARIDTADNAVEQFQADATEALLNTARLQTGQYLLAASGQLEIERLLAGMAGTGPPAGDGVRPQVIEAESFTRGNVTRTSDGYGAGIGVIFGPGGKNTAEFDVDVSLAGRYYVAARYAAAEPRPTRIRINGQVLAETAAGDVTGSWNPDTQKWSVAGQLDLPTGRLTICLERDGPIPHFDKLALIHAQRLQVGPRAQPLESGSDEPIPGLVQQWARYLAKTVDDPDSVLSYWHTRTLDRDSLPASLLVGQALGIDSLPALMELTPSELAQRYHERFTRVQQAWAELRSREDGKSASGLDNPADEAFRRVLYDPEGPLAAPQSVESHFPADTALRLKQLREEKSTLEKSLPKFSETMAVTDDAPQNARIHIRGSHVTLGEEVPRRFPRAIAGPPQRSIGASRSGRLEFAEWLTSREHPLTARVMVNRIWQGHFGQALVTSPDNFGELGDRPSHPDLLDYLAVRLAEDGWSIKAAHRLIMSSATYQASTDWSDAAAAKDPENRLAWRMSRQRLDAETLRDALLCLGDQLDLTMGGSLLPTANRNYVTSTANVNPVVYDTRRRSIYLPVVRSALYEQFQAFDFADPSTLNGKRDTTTVAPQALFMMNSKLVAEQTRALAEQLLAREELSDDQRVQVLFEKAYGRPASEQEVRQALDYVVRFAARAAESADPRPTQDQQSTPGRASGPLSPRETSWLTAWQSLCRAVVSANELIYVE